MIKYNIIFLYVIYIIVIFILSIIDLSIILYYIFWIFNVFIYPFFWLCLKILFYNRTVLLLLLFYYLIAYHTIEIGGYKYFYFFGLDVKKYSTIYNDYIWNMTAHHIELISIFLFFIVIIGPLFYFNKEIIMLLCLLVIILILLRRVFKIRLKMFKWGGTFYSRIGHFIIFLILFFIIFKIMKYQHIRGVFTLYFYVDAWIYNLLEWKIQMYKISTVKDIYTTLLGLKPTWFTLKENIKDKLNEKKWDNFIFKKKKIKLQYYFEYKLKKKKNNYYLYYKNAEWFKYLKYNKLKYLKYKVFENFKKCNHKKINFNKDVKTWQFISSKKPNENQVVTAEKQFERSVHKLLILRDHFKCSMFNYYKLNNLLNSYTIKKEVYKEPFFNQKSKKVLKMEFKKRNIYMSKDSSIKLKTVLDLFDLLLKKIKRNKEYMKFLIFKKKQVLKTDSLILKKLIKYVIVKKHYHFKEFSILKLLKRLDARFVKNKEYVKSNIVKKYTLIVLNKESKYKTKDSNLLKYPKFIKREQLEKIDNKLLLKTLNKYEKEKNFEVVKGKKRESSIIIQKNKKKDLVTDQDRGPDLSRRNNK